MLEIENYIGKPFAPRVRSAVREAAEYVEPTAESGARRYETIARAMRWVGVGLCGLLGPAIAAKIAGQHITVWMCLVALGVLHWQAISETGAGWLDRHLFYALSTAGALLVFDAYEDDALTTLQTLALSAAIASALWSIAYFAILVAELIRVRTAPPERYPTRWLLVDLVETAQNTIEVIVNRWSGALVLRQLEGAARRAEFHFLRLSPRDEKVLRDWTATMGAGVAATLRAHKKLVIDPDTRRQVACVTSLANGVRRVAEGEWESLATLTDLVSIVSRSTWRRVVPRVALFVVLVALAVALPYVLSGAEDISAGQVTLVIAAVFSLVSPDVAKARDVVMSEFGRTR
jgi:hypothetical protein